MAVKFRGSAHAALATVSKPTGVAAGDRLVAFMFVDGLAAITPPSGWSLVGRETARFSIYTKVATGAEPSSYNFATSASQPRIVVGAYYDDLTGQTPLVDTFSVVSKDNQNNQYATAPGISLSRSGILVGGFYSSWANTGYQVEAPAGMTTREFAWGSGGILLVDVAASAGSTGNKTAYFGPDPALPSWDAALVAIVGANVGPSAPIPTSPTNNAVLNRANPIPLAATFSDPDVGDSPSASQWRYRIRDIGAAWTTVSQPNTLQSYSIPAGLAAGAYEWQAAYADQQGVWGPFCTSAFFTAGDPPPGPVWLDPINGQTIAGDTYTGVISQTSLTESEWTLYADNAGTMSSTILQGPVSVTTGDLRRHTFTGLANNTPVWWSVTTKDAGLWSPVVSIRTPVSFTPPPMPVVTTTAVPTEGALDIAIVNPAPGGGEPAAAYNNVWIDDRDGLGWVRKATLLATNTTWRYWSPRSGIDTGVKVETVAVNGTSSETIA